ASPARSQRAGGVLDPRRRRAQRHRAAMPGSVTSRAPIRFLLLKATQKEDPMILVTGATGSLGTALVPRLTAAGHSVRALSRKPARAGTPGVSWATGDLITGEGLGRAVADAGVIIHAATDAKPRKSADPAATERLLAAVKHAGSRPHVVYISIVGVEN